MGLSIFLAKFFGLFMLIMSAIWLFRRDRIETLSRDIMSNPGLLAFAGVINLMLGLAIAIAHPVWELNWRGLITFLGYLSIFRAILLLAFPEETERFSTFMLRRRNYWLAMAIMLLLGLYLAYYGFLGA